MLFESWLVLHAADLVQQAASHIAITVHTVQSEAHLLLDEITQRPTDLLQGPGGTNGGCQES